MMSYKKYIAVALMVCVAATLRITDARADSAKDRFLSADDCYQKLTKSPKRQKYRDNWLPCIQKFESVHDFDPAGPWAAAGLFMAGKLYGELYGHSYASSDQQKALSAFNRVIDGYPRSRYKTRAQTQISAITAGRNAGEAKEPAKPVVSEKTRAAKRAYTSAESCYTGLRASQKKQKYRENWLGCIQKFESAYKKDPAGPYAAQSLFMAGALYDELHAKSYRKADKLASIDRYDRVVTQFPETDPGRKAAAVIGRPSPKTGPDPDPAPQPAAGQPEAEDSIAGVIQRTYDPPADADRSSGTGGYATVSGLRYWSNPNYTRVVIDADKETDFAHRLLKKDRSLQKPQRLYVDLAKSRLGDGIRKTLPINDDLLIDARAGQHTAEDVRVVVDIHSFETYKIFSLRNPFRIVIDVWGETGNRKPETRVAALPPHGGPERVAPGALARQLALGVSRIVIDPGHGGKDYGAPGYLKGVHEKRIALDLAKRLAEKIRKDIGCEVILTRSGDRYLTLEERTAIANTKNADLFISLHTNSARNRDAYGIETFFLNLATDDDAILVAARENATSKKNISDLQNILSDLMQNAKINESSRLAGIVQQELYGHMKKRYSKVKSKGVKQAPFYVLLGAQMPAILVETSFISNPRECRRLTETQYQENLCDGIVNGIRRYIQEIHPTARSTAPESLRVKG